MYLRHIFLFFLYPDKTLTILCENNRSLIFFCNADFNHSLDLYRHLQVFTKSIASYLQLLLVIYSFDN